MHRCLQIQELLSIIFQYVDVPRKADFFSPDFLARLARTCKAFQDPALDILWYSQDTLLPLLKCLPPDAWAWKEGKFSITRDLVASDYKRIDFYSPRIQFFGRPYPKRSEAIETQALHIIWSQKPSPGPLLCNVSVVELVSDAFIGLAIYPRLVIGPRIRDIRIRPSMESPSWANITAVLKEAAPSNLTNFMLRESARRLSWSENESLELLSTLRSVQTLIISGPFCTSRDISTIATLPALERLDISIAKEAMENYIPPVGNDFPAITRLAIESETIDACQLLLVKIKSMMLRSLLVTRLAFNHWDLRSLFTALHSSNLASTLETINVYHKPCIPFDPDEPFLEESFRIDSHTFELVDSFKHLRDLYIGSSSLAMDDDDLLKLAKSLPQVHSLVFHDTCDPENRPKCTLAGMQHIIQFCPKLNNLELRLDARRIPMFVSQPDSPIGSQLTALNLCNSPVSNAYEVTSYLAMLLPLLTNFTLRHTQTDRYSEEEEAKAERYYKIWLKVRDLLSSSVTS